MNTLSIDERLSTGLFTVQEACRLLAISNTAAYQFMKTGQLEHVKLGKCRRIPGPSIKRMLADGTTGSPKKRAKK